MILRFLGTGTSQGIPVIGCRCSTCLSPDSKDKRLRTSVLVSLQDLNLVIDTGPDFRQQMLSSGIDRLDAVLFTHEHMDHIAGLDDVRAFNFSMRRHMPVYASAQVFQRLRRNFDYAFDQTNRYPGVPELIPHEIDESPFTVEGVEVVPLPVWHYRMQVLGFRMGNLAYITDANRIEEETFRRMQGVEVLVINALRHQSHISHFTLAEALEMIQRIGAKRSYLIHMSHQLEPHESLQSKLPDGVFLSYDGLEVELPDPPVSR